MLSGAAWTLGLRLLTRALGVVATLVVARNVPQAELGSYGVIVILDVAVMAITGVGFMAAIVQMEEDPSAYVNTAWTGDAARAIGAFLFELVVAPYWCDFFRVPEATNVLRVFALGQLVLGLHSASTVLLMRELKFGVLSLIYLTESFVFSGFAIVGAIVTKSYLALVGATLASIVARVIASYLIHPYRPRLEFDRAKARRMFRFVRWTMAYSGADFALEMTDNAVTGRMLGTTALAHYRMGYQMAMEGPVLLQWIVGRIAFPAIARVQASAALVRKNTIGILAFTASTIVPAAVLLVALAPRVIAVLLGPKWLPAVVPLRLLAVAGLARALMAVAPPILRGVGSTRTDFLLKVLQVGLMCGLLFPLGKLWGITGIAVAVDIGAVVALPVVLIVLARTLALTVADLLRALVPPALAAILASAAFVIRGDLASDVVGGVIFCAGYVAISWIFVRVWPHAGIGATRGIGDEAS